MFTSGCIFSFAFKHSFLSDLLLNRKSFSKTQHSQVPVAHVCNPNYWEAEVRRIMVQSQLRQIVCKILSQKKKEKERKKNNTKQGWWHAQVVAALLTSVRS
jgi:hypothetical protein